VFKRSLRGSVQWAKEWVGAWTGSGYFARLKKLRAVMESAASYEEWKVSAVEVDILEGKYRWKDEPKSIHFDYERIEKNLETLRELVDCGDIEAVMRYLRSRLLRNLGGIGNQELHSYLRCGTKSIIEEYVDEVVRALKLVADEVRFVFCFCFFEILLCIDIDFRITRKSQTAENLHSSMKLGMRMGDLLFYCLEVLL
jgi:hypothetical protein